MELWRIAQAKDMAEQGYRQGRIARGRQALGRLRGEYIASRRARRGLGPIKAADRDAGRAILSMLRPFQAPMPMIRIGPENDGGYVLPDDLEGIAACFSPGVSNVIGFDEEIAARGIRCFLADGSVEGPANPPPGIRFERLFLGAESGQGVISLDDWVRGRAPPSGDLMLQMDIEGAEYDVLGTASAQVLSRFRIIVLEYHRLESLFTPQGRDRIRPALEALARDFEVVHVHGNNHAQCLRMAGRRFPPVLEVSYLRRDRMARARKDAVIPHPFDRPNSPRRPDLQLSRFWDTPRK